MSTWWSISLRSVSGSGAQAQGRHSHSGINAPPDGRSPGLKRSVGVFEDRSHEEVPDIWHEGAALDARLEQNASSAGRFLAHRTVRTRCERLFGDLPPEEISHPSVMERWQRGRGH